MSQTFGGKSTLEDYDQQIRAIEQTLHQQDKRIQKEVKVLKKIELSIAALAKAHYGLKQQLNDTQMQYNRTQLEIESLHQQFSDERQTLTQQVRVMAQLTKTNPLKLFFTQQSNHFQRTLMSFGHLTEHQKKSFCKLQQALETLNNKSSTLHQLATTLKQLSTEKQKQHAQLQQQLKARQTLLNTWQHEQNKHQQTLKSLKRDAAILTIPKLTSSNMPTSYRQDLIWPLATPLKHPLEHHAIMENRYVLPTPTGQPVRSIYAGKVIFADWLRGFGLMMIVAHDQNYMSLYGHNQSLFKNVGDEVKQGETIALSGESGGQREPGLYFEVRQNGKSINPERWFR